MISGVEYNPYYSTYIDLAKKQPLLDGLKDGMTKTMLFFKAIPAAKHEYRYADKKWSPKEVLLHLIDTERVFMYRAMQFARANKVVLEGFDQDEFVQNANADARLMSDLINEYEAVRKATLAFMASCTDETLVRAGVASNSPLSVRAAAYICCGHEIHHMNIITERYLD